METQNVSNSTFDIVYKANMKKVYRIAYKYTQNHHTSQDITQSVFMKLYANIENINMENAGTWLMVTAKHMALNEATGYVRCKQEVLVDEVEDEIDEQIYLDSLEDTFIEKCDRDKREELAKVIYKELYAKNSRWYEAVTITYILEKPQKEVAETMGISLGALQLMLFRAKNWIRKKYQKKLEDLEKE